QIVNGIFQSLDGENATDNTSGDVDEEDRKNGTPHLGSRDDNLTRSQANKIVQFMEDTFGEDQIRIQNKSRDKRWYGDVVDVAKAVVTLGYGDQSDVGWDDGTQVGSIHGYKFTDLFTDNPDRLRNVHFTNELGGSRDWVNVYQPGFDSLLELVKFMPGWVCQVLPYDHLGTLYIGPPEGSYFYTGKYNRQIIDQIKKVPRPVRSNADDILDTLDELGQYIREQSPDLFVDNTDPEVVFEGVDAPWYIDAGEWVWHQANKVGNLVGLRDDALEEMSENLGDMTHKYETLKADYPALIKFAIPAFFGFDMIEDENMPMSIRREFWEVVEQMVANSGSDFVEENYAFHPGFKMAYETIWKTTNSRTEKLIHDFAFAGYLTDYDEGIFGGRINDGDVADVIEFEKPMPYITLMGATPADPKPTVEIGYTTITIDGKAFNFVNPEGQVSISKYVHQGKVTALNLVAQINAHFTAHSLPYKARTDRNIAPTYREVKIDHSTETPNAVRLVGKEEVLTKTVPSNSAMTRWDGTIVEKMEEYYEVFRWWFARLYEFANKQYETPLTAEKRGTRESSLKVMNEELGNKTWLERRPDKKPFRDYHVVTSRADIIHNNIVASTKQMHNSVLVRYPSTLNVSSTEGGVTSAQGGTSSVFFIDHGDTKWKNLMDKQYGIPFHEDIQLEERKLLISLEKNAFASGTGLFGWKKAFRSTGFIKEPNQYLAAAAFLNLMGESLRPMYRGNIHLWGRSMKPYDWIKLFDIHNEMRGMFEVEQVVHNFDGQTGWTTTIVPHALVHVNNATAKFVSDRMSRLMATLSTALTVWEYADWLLCAMSLGGSKLITTGLKFAGKGALKAIKRKALKKVVTEAGTAAVEKQVGKAVINAVKEGSETYFQQSLKGKKLMEVANFMSEKMGVNLKRAAKKGTSAYFLHDINDMIGTLTEAITKNDIPSLNGVVTLTPLIYQGRPFVAGLKMDKHVYHTRWNQLWRSLDDIWEGAVESLTDMITGKEEDKDPEVDAHFRSQMQGPK
ncbi:MAG: hypothetical protein DRP42_05030, partial [Tenericutes bacterium]